MEAGSFQLAESIRRKGALILSFALLLAVLAVPAVGSDIADAQASKRQQAQAAKKAVGGKFDIQWGKFKKVNRPAARVLRKSGAMQRVVRRVNRMVTLPRDIEVVFSDQLDIGPAYLPNVQVGRERMSFLHIPGDFLTSSIKELRPQVSDVEGLGAARAMVLSMKTVLAHELGHAMVHQLRLPITGKEEDAVDGFAAYLLMQTRGYDPMALFSTAAFFDAISTEASELTVSHFADEHSLLQQRVYQFLCWVYGSAPKRYRGIIDDEEGLPRERAVRCRGEYRQLVHSWGTLIRDYGNPPRFR